MMRHVFYVTTIIAYAAIYILHFVWPPAIHFLWVVVPLTLVGIYDIFSSHNVLRNYPVIGHLRYMMEFIRPEIRQYFIASDFDGRPFNREQRTLVYKRAKQVSDVEPFGTRHDVNKAHYLSAAHTIRPKHVDRNEGRIMLGGPHCERPYHASRLNISAMSFGALSPNAIRALNLGAKAGNFFHNTGEGGLSPYHLQGGDVCFQIGTGYFGCRTPDGKFDPEQFAKKANREEVKMIEIKISQGAKPSHGGICPGAKVNEEISKARGVPVGQDCISPPAHTAFETPLDLMDFITQLRKLSGGKPVGFKLCIGEKREFLAICKAMLERDVTPDFITVDGAEGGTGAAPAEFANRLGTPIDEAIYFVHQSLKGINKREHIRLISSGKIVSGFDMVHKFALGADMCNMARPFMFAIGCIQALRCHTNKCPTGVTTQDPTRYKALVYQEKWRHVKNYHETTVNSMLDLVGAMGLTTPSDLTTFHLIHRTSGMTCERLSNIHEELKPGALLGTTIPAKFANDWQAAHAEHF